MRGCGWGSGCGAATLLLAAGPSLAFLEGGSPSCCARPPRPCWGHLGAERRAAGRCSSGLPFAARVSFAGVAAAAAPAARRGCSRAARRAVELGGQDSAWKVFDLTPGAEQQDIRKRYRELVAREHPDKRPEDPQAPERFKRITEAYRELMAKSAAAARRREREASGKWSVDELEAMQDFDDEALFEDWEVEILEVDPDKGGVRRESTSDGFASGGFAAGAGSRTAGAAGAEGEAKKPTKSSRSRRPAVMKDAKMYSSEKQAQTSWAESEVVTNRSEKFTTRELAFNATLAFALASLVTTIAAFYYKSEGGVTPR